jgi:hypothetical protein
MNTITKIQELALPKERNARRIVSLGLMTLALMVSMYVYFVGKIVFDVVGRRTAEASIRSLQSSISTTSMAYFDSIKTLDLAAAESAGLYESHDTLYASRPLDATAASVAVR